MAQSNNRSGWDYPDIANMYAQTQKIRREAEIARSEYMTKLVSLAAAKISHAVHAFGDVLSFAQRMNTKVRL